MMFTAFEGPAGTGKTFQLVEAVRSWMAPFAPEPHHRVLALTFMHGSRRRLDERFSQPPEVRGRATCMTIDSFASHILRRWLTDRQAALDYSNFDEVCDVCGALLERPEVAEWVSATFPIVAVDEAQELKPCRLRIVKALATRSKLVVAADEFQCLDENLDTAPFLEWFRTGDIRRLKVVRRTKRAGLLDAGTSLRAGEGPIEGAGFRVQYQFPNQMPFSIGHALNGARGTTALICAPGAADWANKLLPRLTAGFQSRRQVVPPIDIGWESAASDEAAKFAAQVCPLVGIDTGELVKMLSTIESPAGWIKAAINTINLRRCAFGKQILSRAELTELFERKVNAQRAFGRQEHRQIPVTSIHGAKNREFRNVIILWPPGVPGSEEYHRRLLYNAVTRAEHQATVFVRTRNLLSAAPFA